MRWVLSRFGCIQLFVTLWTIARQAPQIPQARILEWVAMRSFRDLPDPGIEPMTPKLLRLRRIFTAEPRGKPHPYSLGLLLSAPLSTLQKPYNSADGSRSEFMTTDLRYALDSARQCHDTASPCPLSPSETAASLCSNPHPSPTSSLSAHDLVLHFNEM